jgi:hypothetical protein
VRCDVGLVVKASPGITLADVHRLAALNRQVVRHACLCSVVAVPPRQIPPLLKNQ